MTKNNTLLPSKPLQTNSVPLPDYCISIPLNNRFNNSSISSSGGGGGIGSGGGGGGNIGSSYYEGTSSKVPHHYAYTIPKQETHIHDDLVAILSQRGWAKRTLVSLQQQHFFDSDDHDDEDDDDEDGNDVTDCDGTTSSRARKAMEKYRKLINRTIELGNMAKAVADSRDKELKVVETHGVNIIMIQKNMGETIEQLRKEGDEKRKRYVEERNGIDIEVEKDMLKFSNNNTSDLVYDVTVTGEGGGGGGGKKDKKNVQDDVSIDNIHDIHANLGVDMENDKNTTNNMGMSIEQYKDKEKKVEIDMDENKDISTKLVKKKDNNKDKSKENDKEKMSKIVAKNKKEEPSLNKSKVVKGMKDERRRETNEEEQEGIKEKEDASYSSMSAWEVQAIAERAALLKKAQNAEETLRAMEKQWKKDDEEIEKGTKERDKDRKRRLSGTTGTDNRHHHPLEYPSSSKKRRHQRQETGGSVAEMGTGVIDRTVRRKDKDNGKKRKKDREREREREREGGATTVTGGEDRERGKKRKGEEGGTISRSGSGGKEGEKRAKQASKRDLHVTTDGATSFPSVKLKPLPSGSTSSPSSDKLRIKLKIKSKSKVKASSVVARAPSVVITETTKVTSSLEKKTEKKKLSVNVGLATNITPPLLTIPISSTTKVMLLESTKKAEDLKV